MQFDYIKLDMDIRKKQFANRMSEKHVVKEMGISRSTIWRMSMGNTISIEVFCKMATWTGRPVARYFNNNL